MENEINKLGISINKIRDDLRNNSDITNDLNILLKLKDVPEDIYELLLLMHTYNKHNMNLDKTEFKTLLADLLNIIEKLTNISDRINKNVSSSKKKLFTLHNLPYILGTVFGLFFLIWLAYMINPEATDYVMTMIHTTFTEAKKHIITTIFKTL